MTVPRHFRQRCYQRIGPDADAEAIWAGMQWAIENERHDLCRFEARADRNGRRWFRVCLPDRRTFFILVDTSRTWVPLTVLPPGSWAARPGADSVCLGENAWSKFKSRKAARRKSKGRRPLPD